VQAEQAEHPVQHVGDAGHVARVLQEGDHQEDEHDQGQKAHDPAHARDDAVHQQGAQQAVRHGCLHGLAAPGKQRLEPFHGELTQREGDLVHQEQHSQHEDGAKQLVGQEHVQLVGGLQAAVQVVADDHAALEHRGDESVAEIRDDGFGVGAERGAQVARHLPGARFQPRCQFGVGGKALLPDLVVALQVFEGHPAGGIAVGQEGLGHDARGHLGKGRIKVRAVGDVHGLPASLALGGEFGGGGGKLGNAGSPAGHQFDDRAVQRLGETLGIDLHPHLVGLVHHVEAQHQGDAQLQKLHRQVQVALQRPRVQHVHDRLGALVHQEVARHELFGGIGREGVGSGQVHQIEKRLIGAELADLLLHGDAGVVAHVGSSACHGIEERGLACVGVARQGDGVGGQCRLPGAGRGLFRSAVLGLGAHVLSLRG